MSVLKINANATTKRHVALYGAKQKKINSFKINDQNVSLKRARSWD